MTVLTRIVPTGSQLFDGLLGGGLRLVRRVPSAEAESAVVLLRGGPGTGKSVLGADLALRVARALGCDVLYACGESVPTEVAAQQVEVGLDLGRVVQLSDPESRAGDARPALALDLVDAPPYVIDTGGTRGVDLCEDLLESLRCARGRGCDPRVVVVDALSADYPLALDAHSQRVAADALCKLAAQQGWVLVLLEEDDGRPSPWSWVADAVIELSLSAISGERHARALKHRFGPRATGPTPFTIEAVTRRSW